MKPTLLILAGIFLTVVPQSASACCLFPFLPAYTAGYGGWGFPGYAAYAPAYYGGGGYYGGQNACCNNGYGMAAPAYSAGYATQNSCGSSCGTSCCDGCSNVISAPFSSGKPVPDPISDRDLGDDRTYKSPRGDRGYDDREPADSFDKTDSIGSGRSERDEWDRSRDRIREDLDDRYGAPRSNTDPSDDRFGAPRSNTDSTDDRFGSPRSNTNDFDNRYRDDTTAPLFNSNRPNLDGESTSPDPSPVDQTTNKPVIEPPMNVPVEEDVPEPAAPEPAPTADDSASAREATETSPPASGDDDSAGAAGDGDPKDFLEPEAGDTTTSVRELQLSQRELRNSHFDVTGPLRLALTSRTELSNATTQVSSSRTKVRVFRWISLPLPEGRNRL